MLQIKDIRKQYITGDLVQTALDGVSLTLRDNEFVAILGPSGSGKTTMLNVIGGLDRYDSGDLIINGISTKQYTDRDWDSYRNHTIGFVFQSYNLIPHQTVLANVELALTISGISPAERRKRAAKALEEVGLGNQLHKKPNQMSGGQMQRVAIARALVNNPDILLADEPTGALDSETSVQIMDLLQEVAKDRLVVMVTHNPELAEEYANRIVRVKDGRIIDDTNPYIVDTEELDAPKHKNMGRSSMSFLTALSLSFNNLSTKKARTLLTAFAGSIGIIGIALIMSLSTGFQKYIDQIQEDTLSNYPLSIQSETADVGAALAAFGSSMAEAEKLEDGIVGEQQMISSMFSQIGENDLASLKSHLEENYSEVEHTINAIKYSYGVRPLIFSADTEKVNQVNPSTLFKDLTGSSAMSSYMDSNIFYEMIDNVEMLSSQYDVLRGRWPENYDEMVFVLSDPNQISDYMAYVLGLKDAGKLETMIDLVMQGKEATDVGDPMHWSYEELMDLRFKLVPASSLYKHNPQYNVWEDMSDSKAYLRQLIDQGEELKIVGIVCPREGVSATTLSAGIAYTSALTRHVIETAKETRIVADQLGNTKIDVFTGKDFSDKEDSKQLNFEDMITVDGDALSSAFGMNIDEQAVFSLMEDYLSGAASAIMPDPDPAQQAFVSTLKNLSNDMLAGFVSQNAGENGEAVIRLSDMEALVNGYLAGDRANQLIQPLIEQYGLDADTYKQVFRPLMAGLITGYIAAEMPSVELPQPEVPGLPEDVTLPTLPEDVTLPTLPEDITLPTLPEDVTLPTLPEDVTLPTWPQPSDPTEPATEPTEVPTEATEAVTVPTEPATQPTEATQSTEAATTTTEATTPAVQETTAVTTSSSGTGYRITFLSEQESADSVTTPGSDIGIDFDPSLFYAPITTEKAAAFVDSYTASSLVTGTAGAMATKMLEPAIRENLMNQVAAFGNVLMNYIGGSFYVNEEAIASAFQFNMDQEELQRLMAAMSGTDSEHSPESNLRGLGYADLNKPTSISIYMIDFAGKEVFLDFLDRYNADMEAAGEEDKVISYTDVTGIMMSSVRTIIDSVSYVLIAFVAVSLIVSSIMIGIITYISVMERTKEIGVLRAIGASKRNISQVFNAETFIIGLCSGLLGVGITLLLNFPINEIIHNVTDNMDINAQLPWQSAVVLVILSMILTLIGGLIPSRQAAKKDPVIALRSE